MSPNPELLNQQNGTVAEGLLDRPGLEILGEREGGLIEAMVPMHLINREEVPVNEEHVAKLAKSMQEEASRGRGTGQLIPVLLAAVPGHSKFFIADGFHRDAGLHKNGVESLYATIVKCEGLDDLLDLRILTATNHTAVNFARIVEWVTESWGRSPWAEKINVLQAFTMTMPAGTGARLGVSTDEAAAIKKWVAGKSKAWNTTPSTVRTNLAIADNADPELVKLVRRGSAKRDEFVFTREHLKTVAEGLPRNYGTQRLVVDLVMQHGLDLAAVDVLVGKVSTAKNLGQAVNIVNGLDWYDIKATAPRPKTRTPRVPRVGGKTIIERPIAAIRPEARPEMDLAHELLVSELLLAKAALRNVVYQGRYSVPLGRVGASEGRLHVSYKNDTEVTEHMIVRRLEESVFNFSVAAESQAIRLQQVLQQRFGRRGEEAEELIRTATERVVADIRQGDLRYVDVQKGSVVNDLLMSAMRRDLGTDRSGQSPTRLPATSGGAVNLSLNEVVAAMPRMSRKERAALLMYGLMGITLTTTAVVLNEPGGLSQVLESAQSKVRDGAERNKLFQEAVS